MLIRVIGHFKNNPKHIDKMIAIKGLPEDWIFRSGASGLELAHPWRPDVDKNIPAEVRPLCEPMTITFRYAPVEKGAPWVIERKQILGIVIDYMTEPGRELWEKIEHFIEGTIPRNERVPSMVVLAKDEHSPFETYMPKRDSMNHLQLEPSPVPEIDLRPYLVQSKPQILQDTPVSPVPILSVRAEAPSQAEDIVKPAEIFKCDSCDYTHRSKKGIRMHTMKRHPQGEKVGV